MSAFPNSATVMPGCSCRSRHGWLKKTALIRPEPSPTCAVTIMRRLRVGRFVTERTVTSTSASRPGTRSMTRASSVRSTQRRG